jgi:indole-3-glycerol phosphate synthase
VQASSTWNPPTGTLGAIVNEARARARALSKRAGELERQAAEAPNVPSFGIALQQSTTVAVIAEVKRKSPSKGWIQPNLDAAAQARAYESAGAAAISVLTEPKHFAGSAEDLVMVRSAVAVPVLKKDFHVEPLQLLEAKGLGASAALLIVRALGPDGLAQMMKAADDYGIEVLVEIRDERELDWALQHGADIVGINNRDLETLAIDPSRSERLLKAVPEWVVAIAESGVQGRSDVERVGQAGANAVLVGSSLSGAANVADAVRALVGVRRGLRGR